MHSTSKHLIFMIDRITNEHYMTRKFIIVHDEKFLSHKQEAVGKMIQVNIIMQA